MKDQGLRPLARAFAALAMLALAAAPALAADGDVKRAQRVAIVDHGIYEHSVERFEAEPRHVSGERVIVSSVRLMRQVDEVDAQPGRMFGFQFRVADPALIGQTVTLRRIVPPLTNPKTGRSATTIEGDLIAGPGTTFLNAYGFDYDWERAEGEWTFQVLHEGKVLAEKKFKVILPMN